MGSQCLICGHIGRAEAAVYACPACGSIELHEFAVDLPRLGAETVNSRRPAADFGLRLVAAGRADDELPFPA